MTPENIKQQKSTEELSKKAQEIIDSLENFAIVDKYMIIDNLYKSFMDTCSKNGLVFIENQFYQKAEEKGAEDQGEKKP